MPAPPSSCAAYHYEFSHRQERVAKWLIDDGKWLFLRGIKPFAIRFDEMLSARLSDGGELRALEEKSGLYGDAKTRTVQPAGDSKPPTQYPVSWLPTARTARAWEAVLAGHTVETPD